MSAFWASDLATLNDTLVVIASVVKKWKQELGSDQILLRLGKAPLFLVSASMSFTRQPEAQPEEPEPGGLATSRALLSALIRIVIDIPLM